MQPTNGGDMWSASDTPAAKIARPLVPDDHVMPARLGSALGSHRRVWLEAPGGFGKTAAVARWAAGTGQPVAWVACDAGDADPAALAQALGAALSAALGDGRLALGALAREAPHWPALGRYLVTRLEASAAAPVVVLDDIHRLPPRSPAGALLEALVAQAPAKCRVVLIGRAKPACLPLERWVAEGAVWAAGPEDLRLEASDAIRLFALRGRRVGAQAAEALVAATGGWPLAVALADNAVLDALLRRPHASEAPTAPVPRALLAFLAREVLDAHPARERRFLLAASLPRELLPWLAPVFDPERGAALYGRLVQPPWCTRLEGEDTGARMHAMVRAMLREEAAARLAPGALRQLHRRLAAALVAHGREDEAIEHLLLAGAPAEAAALVCQAAPRLLRAGRWTTVEAWLAALEAAGGAGLPSALVARAHLCAARDDHAAALGLALEALEGARALRHADALCQALAFLVADAQAVFPAWAHERAHALGGHRDAGVAAWADLWRLRLDLLAGAAVQVDAVRDSARRVAVARPHDAMSAVAERFADHMVYLAGHVEDVGCTAAQMVQAMANRRFAYWPALLYSGRWSELDALIEEATAVPAPAWAAGFVRAALDLPRAALLSLTGQPARALEILEAFDRDILSPQPVPAHTLELSVYRAVRSQCLARLGERDLARRVAWENIRALGTSAALEPVGHLDLAHVLMLTQDFEAGRHALHAARAVAGEPGLRGLYHRTLSAAATVARAPDRPHRTLLVRLLDEVAAKGAYGFVAGYDPGPIRSLLERTAAEALPGRLRPVRERILSLMRQGAPGAALADGAGSAPSVPSLRSLGAVAVLAPGGVAPRCGPKVEELFWRLVVAGPGGLRREAVAEAMWPETAAAVQQNRLRVALHGLRRWLSLWQADAWLSLRATRKVVALERRAGVVWDVDEWQRARRGVLAALADGDPERLLASLDAGLTVHRGRLLDEAHLYEAFLAERERLERDLVDTLHRATAALLGRPELAACLRRAVALRPDDPEIALLLVNALAAAGDREGARLAYEQLRRVHADLLGSAPPAFDSLAPEARRP